METQVKPGTRCECRDGKRCHDDGDGYGRQCIADAVRTVTMQPFPTLLGNQYEKQVPMCAACAEYHEAKAGGK